MPTMILEKPRYVHTRFGQGKVMEIRCDDGVYNACQLAKLIGIAPSSLIGRAYRHGWQSPLVFAPKGNNRTKLGEEIFQQNEGNSEWQALGKRERRENLKKIKSISLAEDGELKTCIDPRY